ncbi:MAG: site-specific DNA-methyltransferase [Candidatus Thorarchaeota archaeon]|nr:site-specific DNA-methyltransferase [Candidatus Thorarchaeota archaeon]
MSTREFNEDGKITKDSIKVIEIEGDLDPRLDIPNGGNILIISKDQSYLTHGIHKFPAKFFPELPRYLIRKYSEPDDYVLDPMCGSGTTVLEAMLNKRIGIGIDIDPIARLITKVKTTPIASEPLEIASRILEPQLRKLDNSAEFTAVLPEFHYRDKWFRSFVLRELGIIRDSILTIKKQAHISQVDDIVEFFQVIMSSIIRNVSNADPHCTRTVLRKNVRKKILPGDTLKKFSQRLTQQTSEMKQLSEILADSAYFHTHVPGGTALATELCDESIDLAVTSPPYINAVDYPRTHQLEMYWLGLLSDGPLSKVKRKYIGTETVYKDEYRDLQVSGFETLDPVLKKIYKLDPRRAFIAYKFFEDMKNQLEEMMRILKPGSRYCVAIGNNIMRGVQIKSHEILTEIAVSGVGFELETQFFSKIIRHFIRIPRKERMHGEWVLVLRKPQ